ncbi:MAG: hypothetical protein ACK51N_04215 [bacterium]
MLSLAAAGTVGLLAAAPACAQSPAPAPSAARPTAAPTVRADAASGTLSVLTASGAVVHVRPAPGDRPDRVYLMVSLGLPASLRDDWRLAPAAAAWGTTDRPVIPPAPDANGDLPAPRIAITAPPERVVMRWEGDPADLPRALHRVGAMLRQPAVDQDRLARFRDAAGPRRSEQLAGGGNSQRRSRPDQIAAQAVLELIGRVSGDTAPPAEPADAERASLDGDAVLRVLRRLTIDPASGELPSVEAAITGAMDLAAVVPLADAVFSSLPPRAPPARRAASADASHAAPAPPPTVPLEAGLDYTEVRRDLPSGTGFVVWALPGPALAEMTAFRASRAAAEVVQTRLRAALTDAGLDAPSVRVVPMPARIAGGVVLTTVRVRGDEAQVRAAAQLVTHTFRSLSGCPTADQPAVATGPISPDETTPVLAALSREAREMLASPAYWAAALSSARQQGLTPAALAAAPAAYARLGPADLTAALRSWCRPDRPGFVLLILPEGEKPDQAAKGGLGLPTSADAPSLDARP